MKMLLNTMPLLALLENSNELDEDAFLDDIMDFVSRTKQEVKTSDIR